MYICVYIYIKYIYIYIEVNFLMQRPNFSFFFLSRFLMWSHIVFVLCAARCRPAPAPNKTSVVAPEPRPEGRSLSKRPAPFKRSQPPTSAADTTPPYCCWVRVALTHGAETSIQPEESINTHTNLHEDRSDNSPSCSLNASRSLSSSRGTLTSFSAQADVTTLPSG